MMVIAQNTQYSWSPQVWAIALTVMVFFVLALSLVLILMVHRAGEATAPPRPASDIRVPQQAASFEDELVEDELVEDELQASPASSASTSAEVQTGRTSPVPSG